MTSNDMLLKIREIIKDEKINSFAAIDQISVLLADLCPTCNHPHVNSLSGTYCEFCEEC